MDLIDEINRTKRETGKTAPELNPFINEDSCLELDIRYWRTSTGFEVDFILFNMNVAVGVNGSQRVHSTHARGLKALLEEHMVKRAVIVSLENQPRKLDSLIEILPWQFFLEAPWSGELEV